MNTIVEGRPYLDEGMSRSSEETTAKTLGTGATIEGIGGVAALVLAIIGLSGVDAGYMASIATIILGASLVAEGASIAARYQKLANLMFGAESRSVVSTGMSAEIIGGIAGIVLGVLALLGIMPVTLVACATIVFGAALLLDSGATARLNAITPYMYEQPEALQFASEAVRASAGAQVFVGLGAAVLGILALVGFVPQTLNLVGLLCAGAAVLLNGAAVGGKMFAVAET